MPNGATKTRWMALSLLMLGSGLYLGTAGSAALVDDDVDAAHALVAQEMLLRHDYVVLYQDGIRYLIRPPLHFWMIAASYAALGQTEFATRLPLALAMIGLGLVTFAFGSRFLGWRAGYYAALIVLTSVGMFIFTRDVIPEAIYGLEFLAIFYLFLRAWTGSLDPRIGYWSAAAICALAVLTRGIIGALFPAAGIFGFITLEPFLRQAGAERRKRGWARWRELHLLSSMAIFAVIAAPWHILAERRSPGFYWEYFVNEHINRALGTRLPHDYSAVPLGLWWVEHIVWLFPWSLFAPLLVWEFPSLAFRRQRPASDKSALLRDAAPALENGASKSPARAPAHRESPTLHTVAVIPNPAALFADGGEGSALTNRETEISSRTPRGESEQEITEQARLLLFVWAAAIFAFFSLESGSRMEYYSFGAWPALALLLGAGIAHAEESSSSWIRWIARGLAVVGVAVAVAGAYVLHLTARIAAAGDFAKDARAHGEEFYTSSMAHIMDLTPTAIADLRVPILIATAAIGGAFVASWILRERRLQFASTLVLAAGMAGFFLAANRAYEQFEPELSSRELAFEIGKTLQPEDQIALYGDIRVAPGVAFYSHRRVLLYHATDSNLEFGSHYPDAPKTFLNDRDFAALWNGNQRVLLVVPANKNDEALGKLPKGETWVLASQGGKTVYVNRNPEAERTAGPA